MQITAITRQVRRRDRYSIYIDHKYVFSLSADGLLKAKLSLNQAVDKNQLTKLEQLAQEDKAYSRVLRYISLRPRSQWEIRLYMKRKGIEEDQAEQIMDKLNQAGLIDDLAFAKSLANDHLELRLSSKRKLILELKKKHVPSDIIEQVLSESRSSDLEALRQLITKKRRQSKYQDDLKLMQYLARQGFNYQDIKTAIKEQAPLP